MTPQERPALRSLVSLALPLLAALLAACRTEPAEPRGEGAVEARAEIALPDESESIALALDWLARHQGEDGSWDCDNFTARCEGDEREEWCDGGGHPIYDMGVTGLATLAFLEAGHTDRTGDHQETVRRALHWIREQQDPEGCFGTRAYDNFVYGHSIASLAMAEAASVTGSEEYRETAAVGAAFLAACRNPYRAWRYGVRPGDNDSSVTGWAIRALVAAKRAGLTVDPKDIEEPVTYVAEELTNKETGRVGYTQRGLGPVRPEGKEETYPAAYSESLTASGILCRTLAGEDPATTDTIRKGVALCLARPPEWQIPKLDFYYWYYGALASVAMGGEEWTPWRAAMRKAVLEAQCRDRSCARGSWDPIDAWGGEGGRVYSTALLAMCLEADLRAEANLR